MRLYSSSSSMMPDDMKVGDAFRLQFNGLMEVDWWDWGHVEVEHVDTVVTAPCFVLQDEGADSAGEWDVPEAGGSCLECG